MGCPREINKYKRLKDKADESRHEPACPRMDERRHPSPHPNPLTLRPPATQMINSSIAVNTVSFTPINQTPLLKQEHSAINQSLQKQMKRLNSKQQIPSQQSQSQSKLNHNQNRCMYIHTRQNQRLKFVIQTIRIQMATTQTKSDLPSAKEEDDQSDFINIEDIVDEVITQNLREQKQQKYVQTDKGTDLNIIKTFIQPLQGRIMARITNHNRKVYDSEGRPTPLQAQACACSLQAEFPLLRVDLIIETLHSMFHTQCRASIQNGDKVRSVAQYQNNKYALTDYTTINSTVRAKSHVNLPLDPRFPDEKRVAISYLNFGYGVRILRDFIKDPTMNPTKYNNIVTSIMKATFRKIEEFVKQLGKAVVPINSGEEKILRAPLTNGEKWMPPDELQVFYKFLKIATNLQINLEIQPNTAIRLYNSCIRQLQQRQIHEDEHRYDNKGRGGHRGKAQYDDYGDIRPAGHERPKLINHNGRTVNGDSSKSKTEKSATPRQANYPIVPKYQDLHLSL